MLDAGYSMQTAGIYLFVGLLESHRKLNYAFPRYRKRRSEAIPSFAIRSAEVAFYGNKGHSDKGQMTEVRLQKTGRGWQRDSIPPPHFRIPISVICLLFSVL
jgi:hypothetical protein